jgi:3-hydroxyacyl-[acyl-carrier-protein] dehydratase
MHFCLVDAVLERGPGRIVTIKQVSAAEEYLQDHFPGFPVLPGVLMLEAMVQAARTLLEGEQGGRGECPLVLGGVRAVKYGRFVQPGDALRIEVNLLKSPEDGSFDFRGEGTIIHPGGAEPEPVNGAGSAVSGRFSLRPARTQGTGDFGG